MVNLYLLWIAAAIAAISMTITKSIIFKKFREAIKLKLFKCPYCLSHWISFFFSYFISIGYFDFIINAFAFVTISSLFSIGIDIFIRRMDNGPISCSTSFYTTKSGSLL